MEPLKLISLYVVLVTMVAGRRRISDRDIRHISRENMKLRRVNNEEGAIMCARFAKEPFFRMHMLLGQTWRVYYSWNMDLQKQCLDMTFQNATASATINRIHDNMSEYLKTEPHWDAPSVLVSVDHTNLEMLLFADQGSTGMFQGVPNVNHGQENSPEPASVPLLKFRLKLLYRGKYLLMADCQTGVTTLSGHRKNIANRTEITKLVNKLDFGSGLQACS